MWIHEIAAHQSSSPSYLATLRLIYHCTRLRQISGELNSFSIAYHADQLQKIMAETLEGDSSQHVLLISHATLNNKYITLDIYFSILKMSVLGKHMKRRGEEVMNV